MASTREWFETVEEARRRARRRLPRPVYMALVAGAEKGVTLQDNLAAFSELRFAPPRIANLPAARLGLLQRKRLELARAVASRPRLLLLDEVAGGLTDPEVAQLVEIVRGINAEGIAVIWIEHVVRALTAAVSRLICLAGGQFVGDGEPAAVLANPAVREVFLGSEVTASLSGGTLTAEVGDPGEGA